MIERVGRWDCTRLGVLINPEKSPGGQERLIRGHILACEQLLQACEADERRRGQQQPEAAKREQPLTQVVVVMDLAGLGSGHMNRRLINCFQTINAIDEANYPELVGEIHVLNAGWFFGTLWAAIRPLIDTTTAKKVRVDHAHLSALQLFPPIKRLAVGSRCTWARTIWSRRWAQSFYPLSSAARARTRRPTTKPTFERQLERLHFLAQFQARKLSPST